MMRFSISRVEQPPLISLKKFGVDPGWNRALDRCTQLAFAAGIDALRDAGVSAARPPRRGKKTEIKPEPKVPPVAAARTTRGVKAGGGKR